MPIASHVHNAANHTIAKNRCQSYFKTFEALFYRKHQGAIRTDWKTYSWISYHLCKVVTIFQVATSLSIFSTTWSFLTQYRKQMHSNCILTHANWKLKSHHWFWERRLDLNRALNLSHAFFLLTIYIINLLYFETSFPNYFPWFFYLFIIQSTLSPYF